MELNLCLGCMQEMPAGATVCPHCGYEVGTPAKEPYYIQPGSILHGRYLIGRALGSGGFGITYLAQDLTLMQRVAVKEYLPSDFSTRMPGAMTVSVYSGESAAQFEAGLQKYLDEARRLAALTDIPGVVQIRDYFSDNNTAYIVMELLEGHTLKQHLAQVGKLSFDEAAAIMLPVLNTLEAVHTKTWDEQRQGCIIHRDVSPDNIFLSDDGQIKLLDFGAARYASAYHSKSLSVILKPGYAPEEQYRTRGEQGPWSDVYGAAATMYKMLTGITPEDAMERLNKDELKDPRKLGVQMTENQENALMNALNVKAQDRTQSAGQFASDLLSSTPVLRNRIRTQKQDEGKMPLWMKLLCATAGVGVAVVGLLIAFGVLDPNPTHWANRAPDGMTYAPGLINRDVDSAQAKAEDSRLVFKIVDKQYSTLVQRDTIMSQDPTPGTLVSFGSLINVVVSGGVEQIYMPDILQYDAQTASDVLQQMGFVVKLIEQETADYAPGTVLAQSITADTSCDMGTVVELTVATGAQSTDEDVEVPDLSGMTFEQASAALQAVGLYAVKEGTALNVHFADGTVLAQSVPAGQSAKKGGSVGLTLNQLNAAVFMPDVQYKQRDVALATLEALGLKVTVREEESDTVSSGLVISQSVAVGTKMQAGDSVTLVVSLGNDVAVPDVLGQGYDAAAQALADAGFGVSKVEQYNQQVQKGLVFDTNPLPGAFAAKGSTVNVYVSKGKDPKASKVNVPDVLGLTQDAARAALQKLGLGIAVQQAYSESYDKDTVCLQAPASGAEVERGTTVTVTVSLGSEYAQLPDVTGQSPEAARAAIEGAGFTFAGQAQEYSDTVPIGAVCRQSVAPGRVKRGTAVTVYVSMGPEFTAVPSVVRMSSGDAQSTLTVAGFAVYIEEIYNDDYGAEFAPGMVCAQEPAAGTSVRTSSKGSVTIYVSKGSQYRTVPTVSGSSEAAAAEAIRNSWPEIGAVNIHYEHSEDVPYGCVISQDQSGRVDITTCSSVTLTVSAGTAGKEVTEAELGSYPESQYDRDEERTEFTYTVRHREETSREVTASASRPTVSGYSWISDRVDTFTREEKDLFRTNDPNKTEDGDKIYTIYEVVYYTMACKKDGDGSWAFSSYVGLTQTGPNTWKGAELTYTKYTHTESKFVPLETAHQDGTPMHRATDWYPLTHGSTGWFLENDGVHYKVKTRMKRYYYERWVDANPRQQTFSSRQTSTKDWRYEGEQVTVYYTVMGILPSDKSL